MVTFLYGPDRGRLLFRRSELIRQFEKKHGDVAIGHFYGDEEQLGDRDVFLRSQSLFKAAKVAILDEATSVDKKSLRELVGYATTPKDQLLILCAPKKPTKEYAFLLGVTVSSESFELLSGKEWRTFIASAAKSFDINLDMKAMELLSLAHEGDSNWLMTELQKLRALSKKQIVGEEIKSLLPEATSDFWALVNGLKSPTMGRRLELLEEALMSRDGSAKTFHILASLWKEKIPQFANYDLAVKTGKLDYEEALLDLVLS